MLICTEPLSDQPLEVFVVYAKCKNKYSNLCIGKMLKIVLYG